MFHATVYNYSKDGLEFDYYYNPGFDTTVFMIGDPVGYIGLTAFHYGPPESPEDEAVWARDALAKEHKRLKAWQDDLLLKSKDMALAQVLSSVIKDRKIQLSVFELDRLESVINAMLS